MPPDRLLAYRDGARWTPVYEQCLLSAGMEATIERGGAFLVQHGECLLFTGGLGRVALALAVYLTSRVDGLRLVLLARSLDGMPKNLSHAALLRWLAAPENATSPRRPQVVQLAQIGGTRRCELFVAQCDVSDGSALHRALLSLETRGVHAVHGVVHCAGEAHLEYLSEVDRARCEREFAGKVRGAAALHAALGQSRQFAPLRYVLLISSLAAHLGGLGMYAYAAANAALNCCAHRASACRRSTAATEDEDKCNVLVDLPYAEAERNRSKENDLSSHEQSSCSTTLSLAVGASTAAAAEQCANRAQWIAVCFDDWDFKYERQQLGVYSGSRQEASALAPTEGCRALMLAVAALLAPRGVCAEDEDDEREPRFLDCEVLVSTRPLLQRYAEWVERPLDARVWSIAVREETHEDHRRSALETVTELPSEHDLQLIVEKVFAEVLALKEVGSHESFFRIGGDSILASVLLVRLKSALPSTVLRRAVVDLRLIFSCSTVASLTSAICQQFA